jgi:hypothetical protein
VGVGGSSAPAQRDGSDAKAERNVKYRRSKNLIAAE